MATCLVLLNHEISETQFSDLVKMGITEIVYPLESVKKDWAQIPTITDKVEFGKWMHEHIFVPFLNDYKKYDDIFLLVQGEISACIYVCRCIPDSWVPIVAVSERKVQEIVKDGVSTKTAIFEHKGFRRV